MTDITPQQPPTSPRPKRPSRAKRPAENVLRIDVPRPQISSLNKDRPANALIMAQVEHMHHAEKNRLHRDKLSGNHPGHQYTEGEAAAYINHVTMLLHPEGKKKKRSKTPKGA